MLKRAKKYSDEINDFIMDYSNRKYLKYYTAAYFQEKEFSPDEWNSISVVSVRDGKVLGFFSAGIDRTSYNVSNFGVVNMSKTPDPTLTRDLFDFIDELFEVYKFGKIDFFCYVGNPAEKQYDKAIEKLGGRIVGIREKEQKLYDGTMADQKIYEIPRDNYRRLF